MAYRISVDTGGTFTDVVVADETGIRLAEKALTTPDRIFSGMRAAMEAAATGLDVELEELLRQTTILIYGTTRAANAIIQNNVAKTAFLTTEGFRDILVFREGGKFHPHDYSVDYPEPYVPRRYTYEVPERISSEAEIRIPLDLARATEILERLKQWDFEAVAVCFLWSIVNPAHELAMAELIEKHMPGVPYTLSHKLIPIIREYRRASATAIDASLKPLMQTICARWRGTCAQPAIRVRSSSARPSVAACMSRSWRSGRSTRSSPARPWRQLQGASMPRSRVWRMTS